MSKKIILDKIKDGLIVSCQARAGWPMHGPHIMSAFAKAAEEGGAVAIRATGKDNIRAIKKQVKLPILGINKVFDESYEVYITPTYDSAKEILDEGVDIIALDATQRKRPNDETFESIILKIRQNYPDTLIMGEISTIEEAMKIKDLDIDLISTTLSGYTDQSQQVEGFNSKLIKDLNDTLDIPIIAEGKIKNPDEALLAIKNGAWAVVVGTSITRPEIITKRYVEKLMKESLI